MKINKIDISLSLFNGEKTIYPWKSEDGKSARLTMYTTVSKKVKDGYQSLSFPLNLWGEPQVIDKIEANIRRGFQKLEGNKPLSIIVLGGRLGGQLVPTRGENGQEINKTNAQIDLSISNYNSVIIGAEAESAYPDSGDSNWTKSPNNNQGAIDNQALGQSESTNAKDINLEEIKF